MTWECPRLLAMAKGQACTLEIPGVCNGDRGTVVAAHANSIALGKGKSRKAPDWAIAFACSACHHAIDQGSRLSHAERWEYWVHGHFRTMATLFDAEVFHVKGVL